MCPPVRVSGSRGLHVYRQIADAPISSSSTTDSPPRPGRDRPARRAERDGASSSRRCVRSRVGVPLRRFTVLAAATRPPRVVGNVSLPSCHHRRPAHRDIPTGHEVAPRRPSWRTQWNVACRQSRRAHRDVYREIPGPTPGGPIAEEELITASNRAQVDDLKPQVLARARSCAVRGLHAAGGLAARSCRGHHAAQRASRSSTRSMSITRRPRVRDAPSSLSSRALSGVWLAPGGQDVVVGQRYGRCRYRRPDAIAATICRTGPCRSRPSHSRADERRPCRRHAEVRPLAAHRTRARSAARARGPQRGDRGTGDQR